MSKVLLFGYLRRDVTLLGVFDPTEEGFDAQAETLKAVEQGRAQTAWTVTVDTFATASDVNWANPDQHQVGRVTPASSVPPLNPGAGEQETTDESGAGEQVSIRDNIETSAEASPKGPDTGTNPQGEPTK